MELPEVLGASHRTKSLFLGARVYCNYITRNTEYKLDTIVLHIYIYIYIYIDCGAHHWVLVFSVKENWLAYPGAARCGKRFFGTQPNVV